MNRLLMLLSLLAVLSAISPLYAHTVNYEVQQKGIALRVFYGANDPASYSEYEVFAPGIDLPHQTGRTDKNGLVTFVPDRVGRWKIRVLGESSHGFHGITVEVNVDRDFNLESFKKPLVATYTKLITGVSIIFGLFGIYALLVSGRKQSQKTP